MRLPNNYVVSTEFSARFSISRTYETSVEGLCQQFKKEFSASLYKRKLVSLEDKGRVNQMLVTISALSASQVAFIDSFIKSLIERDFSHLQELVSRYKRCPAKLVPMIDFINIELRRRNLQEQNFLSAVARADGAAGNQIGVVYVFNGWSKSGRPRHPHALRTDANF